MTQKVKTKNYSVPDTVKGFIGVFDSGFGGLEILREIVKVLPQYDFVYLGDSLRAPYGDRSQKQIYQFTKQAIDYLFRVGAEIIILACNTASSEALRKIQQEHLPNHWFSKRVLGVIVPVSEAAVALGAKQVGVIGTKSMIASGAFSRELKKLNSKIQVFQQACPLLVPLIEAGKENSKEMESILKKYLKFIEVEPPENAEVQPLKIDALILGCTHYGLLEKQIKKIVGPKVKVVSEGRIVAGKLKDYLLRHPEIENKIRKSRKIKFLTTGKLKKFKALGGRFFQREIFPKKIDLN